MVLELPSDLYYEYKPYSQEQLKAEAKRLDERLKKGGDWIEVNGNHPKFEHHFELFRNLCRRRSIVQNLFIPDLFNTL